MRARSIAFAASRACFIAIALVGAVSCSALSDKAITGVDVTNKADRVVICVEGNHALQMNTLKSTAGRYLGFQFPAKLMAKGRLVGIRAGKIHNVRYSNFSAKPPTTRIVVNTTGHLEFSTNSSPDKRRIEITVWKHGAKPAKAAASVSEPAPAAEPEVVKVKPASASVFVADPPKLSENGRKTYGALRALGTDRVTAIRVAAKQPEPTTRVLGMVETRSDNAAAVEPVRVAQVLGIPTPDVRVEIIKREDVKDTGSNAPIASSGKRVSLNFLGADINDVLKALSLQSGENIVANKDVKGEITVSLTDVTLENALDYVARLSGYGYKKENGVYLIASKDSLRSLAADGSPTSKTELVKLSYAKADDVIALAKLQYPDVQISKVGVELTGRIGLKSKAGQTTIGLQNTLIVLIGPAESVDMAKELIDKFEDAFRVETIESHKALYKIKYVDGTELANTLATLVPGIAVTFAPTDGFDLSGPKAIEVSDSGSLVEQDDTDTERKTEVAGQSAVDSVGTISATGSAANTGSTVSKVQKRKRPQALIISGREPDVNKAMALADEYDVKSPQIKIEAKITSISRNGAKNVGLKWDWSNIGIFEGFMDFAKTTDMVPDGSNKNNIRRSNKIWDRQPFNIGAVLDALVTSGDGKVLASPNLVCLEGKPGVFFVGDEVTYIQRVEVTQTGQNILTDTKQVGVQLRVVGDVSPDGHITLNLHPEVSVLKLTVEQGVSLPVVTRRFTDHVVRVMSGETIVVGGLIRNDEIEEMSKVPLLGDIPFLGHLFRHKSKTNSETEVVMFITASVLPD